MAILVNVYHVLKVHMFTAQGNVRIMSVNPIKDINFYIRVKW